jgi:hypothetical protein
LALADTLAKELTHFRVKVSAAGAESFEALRERDHDDLVLALALACWVGQNQPPPYTGPLAYTDAPTGVPEEEKDDPYWWPSGEARKEFLKRRSESPPPIPGERGARPRVVYESDDGDYQVIRTPDGTEVVFDDAEERGPWG